MKKVLTASLALALATGAAAGEITVKNDSLTDFGNASIVWGFVAGEKAGSWLTSPCTGNLVAVQIFWRSPSGVAPFTIADSIDISRAGTFPQPGDLALQVLGPVLTDNALNEFRYLDENNTLPISVPVTQDETLVVALTFAAAPAANSDPSVVRDTDGIQPNSNTIYADLGGGNFQWFPSSTLGVAGDWVIRAVIDCQAVASNADVEVGMSANPATYTAGDALTWTITVANNGPAAALNTTVVDTFPAAYGGASWTCAGSGGASCPGNGSGHILHAVSLPAGSEVVYTVNGTVAPGTSGTLSNSVAAAVGTPATDPDLGNNSFTLGVDAAGNDQIFANGFDPAGALGNPLKPVPARVWRGIPAAF